MSFGSYVYFVAKQKPKSFGFAPTLYKKDRLIVFRVCAHPSTELAYPWHTPDTRKPTTYNDCILLDEIGLAYDVSVYLRSPLIKPFDALTLEEARETFALKEIITAPQTTPLTAQQLHEIAKQEDCVITLEQAFFYQVAVNGDGYLMRADHHIVLTSPKALNSKLLKDESYIVPSLETADHISKDTGILNLTLTTNSQNFNTLFSEWRNLCRSPLQVEGECPDDDYRLITFPHRPAAQEIQIAVAQILDNRPHAPTLQ